MFEIINFTVKDHPYGAVFIAHGLMSRRAQVNDAEPTMTQTY